MRFREGEQACQKGLSVQPASAELQTETSLLRARLLVWQANFAVLIGELEAAQKMRLKAGALLDQFELQGVDVRRPRAMYWQMQGDAQKDLHSQLECYQRGSQLYRELGDAWRLSITLVWAGELAQRLGDAALCLQYQQEALHLARQVGEPNRILGCLINLTYTYFILNQLEDARQLMQETIVFSESMEELPVRANAHLHLGVQLGWSGRFPEAIEALERALPLLRSLGYRFGTIYGSLALGLITLMTGEYTQGEAILQATLPEAEQGGFPREAASALLGLGMAALALGRARQAVEYFQESTRRYREMQFAGELGWALGGLSLALESDGQPNAAQTALVEALHIAVKTRSMFTMITSLAAMACLLHHRGHLDTALLVQRVLLAQTAHRNSRWNADMIGAEMNAQWESLPAERQAEIDAYAAQHDPFSLIQDVLRLLE